MKKLLSCFMTIGFVLACVIIPTYATDTQPAPVVEKSFDLSTTEIYIGPYDSLDLEVINPVGVDPEQVKWESKNANIAKVNEKGHVEAVAVGDVQIVATIDGIQKECLVHVSKIIHLSLVGVVDGVIIEESRYTSPALLAGQAGFTDEFLEGYKAEIDKITKEESGDTYEFAGMFLDPEGTKAIASAMTFNEDATIYLVWKEKVTVDSDGSKTEPPVIEEEKKPVKTEPTKTTPKKETVNKKQPVQTSDEQSIIMYSALVGLASIMFITIKSKKASRE